MKKLFILLLIMMITLSGCSNPLANKEKSNPTSSSKEPALFQYTETLTVNDVTTALLAEGLPLIKTQTINPADYLIDDIKPMVYVVKQSDHFILLYDYKSITKRKEAEWTGDYFYHFSSKNIPQKEPWFSRSFIAKNLVMIDMVDSEKFQQNYSAYDPFYKTLKMALFKLNNVHKMVFADKGRYFDARLNFEYYQHWYKDDQNRIGVDQYSNRKWQVKYLGSEPESLHAIRYEYRSSYGAGGSGTGLGIQKVGHDSFLEMGSSGSSSIPVKDTVYTLTIYWNGHKETLHLKAVPLFFPFVSNDYFDATLLEYQALCKYMTPPYSSF